VLTCILVYLLVCSYALGKSKAVRHLLLQMLHTRECGVIALSSLHMMLMMLCVAAADNAKF
jgi:hypothetical protein